MMVSGGGRYLGRPPSPHTISTTSSPRPRRYPTVSSRLTPHKDSADTSTAVRPADGRAGAPRKQGQRRHGQRHGGRVCAGNVLGVSTEYSYAKRGARGWNVGVRAGTCSRSCSLWRGRGDRKHEERRSAEGGTRHQSDDVVTTVTKTDTQMRRGCMLGYLRKPLRRRVRRVLSSPSSLLAARCFELRCSSAESSIMEEGGRGQTYMPGIRGRRGACTTTLARR